MSESAPTGDDGHRARDEGGGAALVRARRRSGGSASGTSTSPGRGFVPPALGPRGEGWFVAQVALLGGVALLGLAGGGVTGNPVLFVAGAALAVGGFVLAVRGVADLRENLTVFPRPRQGSRLVDRGAYGLVRHPIYGGLILGSLGWSIASGSWPALACTTALAALLGLKSQREEAWLRDELAGYEAYRGRTRRFIPWVL